MQFKDFIWPHNPRLYTIEFSRRMAFHKVPFGRYHLQNLGMNQRVIRGEGEFVGPTAYSEFKKLASLFYQDTPGVLCHPIWQSMTAYFVELALTQEPKKDYIRYRFGFWEQFEGYSQGMTKLTGTGSKGVAAESGKAAAQYHQVVKGDSLWKIAGQYGLSLTRLLELNPQIKNPNRIYPGEQVRVR